MNKLHTIKAACIEAGFSSRHFRRVMEEMHIEPVQLTTGTGRIKFFISQENIDRIKARKPK